MLTPPEIELLARITVLERALRATIANCLADQRVDVALRFKIDFVNQLSKLDATYFQDECPSGGEQQEAALHARVAFLAEEFMQLVTESEESVRQRREGKTGQ